MNNPDLQHPLESHFHNEGHMVSPDDIRHQLGTSVPASLKPYTKPLYGKYDSNQPKKEETED